MSTLLYCADETLPQLAPVETGRCALVRRVSSERELDAELLNPNTTGWVHVAHLSDQPLGAIANRTMRNPTKLAILVEEPGTFERSLRIDLAAARWVFWLHNLDNLKEQLRRIVIHAAPHSIGYQCLAHLIPDINSIPAVDREFLCRLFIDMCCDASVTLLCDEDLSRQRTIRRHACNALGLAPPKDLVKTARAIKAVFGLSVLNLTAREIAAYLGLDLKTVRRILREVYKVNIREARLMIREDVIAGAASYAAFGTYHERTADGH